MSKTILGIHKSLNSASEGGGSTTSSKSLLLTPKSIPIDLETTASHEKTLLTQKPVSTPVDFVATTNDQPNSAQLSKFNKTKTPKTRKPKKVVAKKTVIEKVYLCPNCHTDCQNNPKSFGENSICCTQCSTWFHFKCVSIFSEDDIPHVNAKWLCHSCSPKKKRK